VDDEGEEKMLVVNVMEGEHGAAIEEKLVGKGLEAEFLEGDAKGRLGAASEERHGDEQEQPRQSWTQG